MEILISKPNYSDEFLFKTATAKNKGVEISILPVEDGALFVLAQASGRTVGRFTFNKIGNVYLLEKKHVIEREFYPFELAIMRLVTHLKRKKIKCLLTQ